MHKTENVLGTKGQIYELLLNQDVSQVLFLNKSLLLELTTDCCSETMLALIRLLFYFTHERNQQKIMGERETPSIGLRICEFHLRFF